MPEQPGGEASISKAQTIRIVRRELSIHSGPLPSPETLARYEQLMPGAVELLFKVFERQVEHRMELEKIALKTDSFSTKWGMGLAFVIAMTFLAVSGFLIFNGHELGGTVLGTVDLTALVTVFILGSRSRREEREEKAKIMTGQK